MNEEKFYDYQIELKGRPKLDVTQPDSETTKIIKEFKDFQIDAKNFKLFKVQLDTWYASKISSLNEQIYDLAEHLKCFPEIDETNFQFEDRKKMTKEEKMEMMLKLPIFTEEWRDKVSTLMRLVSKAFTNSIFLIDILWDADTKMSECVEILLAKSEEPKKHNVSLTSEESIRLAEEHIINGKSFSQIKQEIPEFARIPTTDCGSYAKFGAKLLLKSGKLTMEKAMEVYPSINK